MIYIFKPEGYAYDFPSDLRAGMVESIAELVGWMNDRFGGRKRSVQGQALVHDFTFLSASSIWCHSGVHFHGFS